MGREEPGVNKRKDGDGTGCLFRDDMPGLRVTVNSDGTYVGWTAALHTAISEIPGITVVKMDVDFDKEKMYLVLDHPEKNKVPRGMKVDEIKDFAAVGKAVRKAAPEWAWVAWKTLDGDDSEGIGASTCFGTTSYTTWDFKK